MHSEVANKTLMRLLQEGDEPAFAQAYHQHKQPLFYLSLRYLKDKSLAEDALQEVFIKLWKEKDKLDPELQLKGFLFTCMKHHLLNTIRSEETRIRNAALTVIDRTPASNFTEQDVAFLESKSQLEKGILKLSEGKGIIFRLSFEKGYSTREIAKLLDLSENTVRSQLSQSTKFLRQHVNNAMSILIPLFSQF
jgi:RNA polymerase sigma-70 factor (family 1)